MRVSLQLTPIRHRAGVSGLSDWSKSTSLAVAWCHFHYGTDYNLLLGNYKHVTVLIHSHTFREMWNKPEWGESFFNTRLFGFNNFAIRIALAIESEARIDFVQKSKLGFDQNCLGNWWFLLWLHNFPFKHKLLKYRSGNSKDTEIVPGSHILHHYTQVQFDYQWHHHRTRFQLPSHCFSSGLQIITNRRKISLELKHWNKLQF